MLQRIILLFCFCLCAQLTLSAQNLISSQLKQTYTKEQVQATLGNPFAGYGAKAYKITYETLDVFGQLDTASGLFVVPIDLDGDKIFPRLVYQHGTVGSKSDVPSNLQGGFQLAVIWASFGYAVSAPDYLGLGDSRGFHPYVHADSEASAAIDMVTAAEQFVEESGEYYTNEQMFITGYSQGGHGAAAAQKAMEAQGMTVTASAPMSGPYSISGVMLDLMLSDEEYFTPAYAPNTIIMLNMTNGGTFYDELDEVFVEPIATWVEQFQNHEITLWDLNDDYIQWSIDNFGASVTKHMFQEDYMNAIINDPNHPVRVALAENDLYDWAPQAPTRLYYCMADDQVPFMNSVIADDAMNAAGAPDLLASDVNPTADHGGCVTPAVTSGYFFFQQYQQIDFLENTVELDEAIAFALSPNPAQDYISIDFETPLTAKATGEIYNYNGQLLQTFQATQNTNIDISDLAKGMYVLKMQTENGIWVKRFVKG